MAPEQDMCKICGVLRPGLVLNGQRSIESTMWEIKTSTVNGLVTRESPFIIHWALCMP